ncbi:MAG TPA: lamin tail domain-containing protein [Bacteroidia bacterium]|jgi:hypothetical protein
MRSIITFFLFISLAASAQVTDDFNDGDFSTAPAWTGDATEFIVNATQQLQLNNTVAGASYLSTTSPAASLDNIQWSFYIKQTFAPSGSNYGRVYLASDQANLEGSLNGYYLQFGEAGSLDAVELFRQTGLTSTSVCRGTNAEIAASFSVGVKIIRDAAGNWSLFVDPAGGIAYALEATGTDLTYTSTGFFGVATVYTISSATKFFFDNFYNGPVIVDVTAPGIVSSTIISSTQLDVLFNENVDPVTSQTLTNYNADNGLGNPSDATRDASDFSLVHLTFGTAFPSALTNTLTINNVQDLNGNAISGGITSFTFYKAKPFDIVINEIMADPDPVVNTLPNYEYIELYNKTAFDININNWSFTAGTNTKILPDVVVPADSFLVLSSSTAAALFAAGVNVMAVTSFPSIANTGQTLILRDQLGAVISTVSYTDDWYQDAVKAAGGYSLEQIDWNNPCAGITNWKASAHANGGTPGAINSINALNSDASAPQLVRVNVIAADTIQLYFNEPLDSVTMLNPTIYTIDNGIGNPSQVKVIAPDFKSVRLAFSSSLMVGTIYIITVANTVTDCAGNFIGTSNSARFAIPEPAALNDLVINEILFDPKTGGVDFVEIYNRSNKVIDLKTLLISEYDTITNVVMNAEMISSDGYLIFPNEYLLLSENGNAVKAQYATSNPGGFLDVADLPAMNIDGGTVCLSTATTIIEHFTYYNNMHFGLLNDTKGISLERINFNRNTNDRTNWHSAAASVGFATPGYKNSQYSDAGETDNAIEITPAVFSPDEDGTADVVNINYHFDAPGYTANVTIYDSKGRIVKLLVRNEMLSTKGTFSWDGINDDREKAAIGIYIVFFEVFDLSGDVKHYKKTCVLAGKL